MARAFISVAVLLCLVLQVLALSNKKDAVVISGKGLESRLMYHIGVSDTLRVVMKELLTETEIIPISDICFKLLLDKMGCLRVETYLGRTLVNLTKPLRLKHKINSKRFSLGWGDVTTKHALQNSHVADTNPAVNPAMKEYAEAFAYIPHDFGDSHPFIITARDESYRTSFKYPTLVRPAPVPDPSGNHVIIRINRHTYEGQLMKVRNVDIPFENKLDSLVWRGSTTGALAKSPCTGLWPNRSRMLLVEKYFNSSDPRIDIKFAGGLIDNAVPKAWVRHRRDISKLLKHKFIMVVDGNSEATSMEWVMASNSVPVMADPIVQTWALHSWLQPWKHYIPVESDFSDLPAKLDWARSNPTQVAQIAKNGKSFMREFRNLDRENRINAAVLAAYFNRFKIEDSIEEPGLFDRREEIGC